MVALNALTLFALLPALVLGATHDSRSRHSPSHNHVGRRVRGHERAAMPQHEGVARRSKAKPLRRSTGKQCRARPATTPAPTPEATPAPADAVVGLSDSEQAPPEDNSWEANHAEGHSEGAPADNTWSAEASAPTEEPAPTTITEQPTPSEAPAEEQIQPNVESVIAVDTSHSGDGLFHITDGVCGYNQPSANEPNGAQWWLDCGLDNNGWNPPMVKIDQFVTAELTADGLFAPCAPFFDKFHQYAAEFGLPPILLASIALQESTCNPHVTGGIGECGLMQLLGPNCDGAPGGNCYDVDFNIRRGAEYFAKVLGEHNGNALAAMGAYNGWWTGMTLGEVYAMKDQGRCFAQPNLDYLTQMVNGWFQGKEGYYIGKYFNRKDC